MGQVLTQCSLGNILTMVPMRTFERPGIMTDFITSAEAAERLGYTVQHVRRLIRQGTLEGEKMGRDWIVEARSVVNLLGKRENLSLPLGEGRE